jgi:peptidoglycan/LPS O-acetylase OafA/YrhL
MPMTFKFAEIWLRCRQPALDWLNRMHAHRNFGLDVARALAITMVFLSHGVTALDTLGVGVDLFFLLSGFLIGRIYLRSQADAHDRPGTFTLWGFWSARWFRTLPPYLAALGLFAVAQLHFQNNSVHPYYLLFLQNYLGMDGFGPSWSLCVEEHFYLALPIIGFVALRLFPRRSLVWLLPALALVPQVFRTVSILTTGLPTNWYWRSHLHCEGLVLGVWLAYVYVDRNNPVDSNSLWQQLRTPAIPLALIPIGILVYQNLQHDQPLAFRSVVFLLYAIGYAAWLRLLYDVRWVPTSAASRLLKNTIHGIALASYSIYLVHTLCFTDIRVLINEWPRGPVKSGTVLAATLVISVLFYFAIERPTITLRDRILGHAKPKSSAVVSSPEPEPS